MKETNIGKYVIVRGDRSGVFAGNLAARDGREVQLTECRRQRRGTGLLRYRPGRIPVHHRSIFRYAILSRLRLQDKSFPIGQYPGAASLRSTGRARDRGGLRGKHGEDTDIIPARRTRGACGVFRRFPGKKDVPAGKTRNRRITERLTGGECKCSTTQEPRSTPPQRWMR